MPLRPTQYLCPAFAGYVIEGVDDELYALDMSANVLYKIDDYCRLHYVDSIERGYTCYRSGYGHAVLSCNHKEHVWKIYSIPSMESFYVRVPGVVVCGYNVDNKTAILYDLRQFNVMLFDSTRKRRNMRNVGFISGLGSINVSRMLAASYSGNRIKIHDLADNKTTTTINPSLLGISFVGFLYPLSETVVIAYVDHNDSGYSTAILSPDGIIFSMFDVAVTSVSSVGSRAVLNLRTTAGLKHHRLCIYADIDRDTYCRISGARYAIATKRGLALQLSLTKAWCIVNDDGFLLDRHGYIELSPVSRSSVLVAQSCTL